MASERIRRRIERLLDEADEAYSSHDWALAADRAKTALGLDPENEDGLAILAAIERMAGEDLPEAAVRPNRSSAPAAIESVSAADHPKSFADGRYQVQKFLGEGGKKRVYLARDSVLDRDVALAVIKTEGLDETSRERITREARAVGRLGDHPHILAIYDFGDEPSTVSGQGSQPYMVLPLIAGDVEGLIDDAPDNRIPVEQTIKIAAETCRGVKGGEKTYQRGGAKPYH